MWSFALYEGIRQDTLKLRRDVALLKSAPGARNIPYQGPTADFNADFEKFEKLFKHKW